MEMLTKAQEQLIVKAAGQIVELANSGFSPDDALYKVASEHSLTPEFVKRLTEVFNTSRVLAHFKTSSSENRADSFPLANAANVLARMYPKDEESPGIKAAKAKCHSTWFSPPPDFHNLPLQKSAFYNEVVSPSYGPADLQMLLKRARRQLSSLERDAEVTRADVDYHREMTHRSIGKSANYFRSISHTPFSTVESNSLTQYGAMAQPLMNAVFIACRGSKFGEKRGSVSANQLICDFDVEPYASIDSAIRHAREWTKAASETQATLQEAQSFRLAFEERLKKLAEIKRERIPFPFGAIKVGGSLISTLASSSIIGDKFTKLTGGSGEEDPNIFERKVQQSIDPAQDSAIRAAKTKALLNEMMSSDPVISGYDPQTVMTAFNEISSLTPRVSAQPALLRGMLARRLEMGRTDPFEAEQAVKSETGLKRIEAPVGAI